MFTDTLFVIALIAGNYQSVFQCMNCWSLRHPGNRKLHGSIKEWTVDTCNSLSIPQENYD